MEVDSNWSERNYKALNENITDLILMESNFKGYPSIFPTLWNRRQVAFSELFYLFLKSMPKEMYPRGQMNALNKVERTLERW